MKLAIEADEKGNITDAIDLYVKALDYFMGALQCKCVF